MSHSSCNKILWNDINSKTRAGMPCIGCTEVDFHENDMFETKKNMGILMKFLMVFQKSIFKYNWSC